MAQANRTNVRVSCGLPCLREFSFLRPGRPREQLVHSAQSKLSPKIGAASFFRKQHQRSGFRSVRVVLVSSLPGLENVSISEYDSVAEYVSDGGGEPHTFCGFMTPCDA